MVERCECVVIGAGVVGLAVARALARRRPRRAGARGGGDVRHGHQFAQLGGRPRRPLLSAGQPEGAVLPARAGPPLPLSGRARHRAPALREAGGGDRHRGGRDAARRRSNARCANGVEDLRWLSGDEARALEPEVRCLAALLSPSTGIFDSHGYMLSLKGEAESARRRVRLPRRVVGGAVREDGIALVASRNDGAEIELLCRTRRQQRRPGRAGVSRARSAACRRQASRRCTTPRAATSRWPAGRRSSGWSIRRRTTPASACTTRAISPGRGRFGPDAQWVEAIDYTVDGRPRRAVLRLDPPLLAGAARRRARPRLRRHPPEDPGAGRAAARFRDPGTRNARRAGPHQPVRHRIARPDLVARHRRARRGAAYHR